MCPCVPGPSSLYTVVVLDAIQSEREDKRLHRLVSQLCLTPAHMMLQRFRCSHRNDCLVDIGGRFLVLKKQLIDKREVTYPGKSSLICHRSIRPNCSTSALLTEQFSAFGNSSFSPDLYHHPRQYLHCVVCCTVNISRLIFVANSFQLAGPRILAAEVMAVPRERVGCVSSYLLHSICLQC